MKNNKVSRMPDAIYVSFVESLYSNRAVILFGFLVQFIIAIAIGESTGDATFYVFAVCFGLTGVLRLGISLLFDNADIRAKPIEAARYWENIYLICVSALGLQIGVMTYLSIVAGDSFAEFASMTLTMATMVTIVGKNFASSRIVHTFTLLIFAPIAVALMQVGGWKHITGAILLVPFSLLISSMSRYVRDFLGEAVWANIKNKAIADRFDVAINNMPHGLIMFDQDGKASVVNKRAGEMIRVSPDARMIGRTLMSILRYCRMRGIVGRESLTHIDARLSAMLRGEDERKYLVTTDDGINIEFAAKKIGTGGGVLLFEDVTERVIAEQKIHRMARFDALTGLPNRVYFRELARTCLSGGAATSFCAFFVIDIDDFKHVNDSMGHPVGDELLCRFADRINMQLGVQSIFSRFGGDEFVGLLTGYASEAAAEKAANHALASLTGTFDVAGHTLHITISSGIVVCRAEAFELTHLMIRADLALYESKSKGKGVSTLFAADMDERYQRRQRLKIDLKKAIRNRELKVFYQPIIDARSMKISACEALCRWDHPEFGPVSPAVFIPLAEETGAITDLTRFMLEQATSDCVTWRDDVSVSVNLSAVDFRSANLEDMIRVALAKSKLHPSRLEVEVTEGAILDDTLNASRILNALKLSGVRIALDDFGTGYSSLSYLHNLPLDKVKIDQSFVRDIVTSDRSLKLVAGVTRLADELGLLVTIEGIETLAQFERLREHAHIDLAQGFLFGAALSPRGISTLIDNIIPQSRSAEQAA